jgi:hypothetical protein
MPDRYVVGPQYGATGSGQDQGRIGISGASIVADGHAHFFEAARLAVSMTGGGLWSAVTGVAGVAPGTALSTTPPMAVWNPPGSGILASICVTRLGYISGTLGAGTIAYAYVSSQTSKPSTGTALTPSAQALGAQTTPRAQAFQGSTLAATPTILAPAYILNAMLATTATQPVVSKDQVDGEIIILPGGVFVMQGIAAAGTSPLVAFGVTWEEIPFLY